MSTFFLREVFKKTVYLPNFFFDFKISNSTGSSGRLCFIQDTTWCGSRFAHPTRHQSNRVDHRESSWTTGDSLAFLYDLIRSEMALPASRVRCDCHSYYSLSHSGSSSARSYSSWRVKGLVPFSRRHIGCVSRRFYYI